MMSALPLSSIKSVGFMCVSVGALSVQVLGYLGAE
ncbi:hypothetical protein ACVWZR_002108 [Bradyrhizobium sp. i1.3.1]